MTAFNLAHLTKPAAARAAVGMVCRWGAIAMGILSQSVQAEDAVKEKSGVAGTTVHYVSETTYRWEGGNPLESIARVLSNCWADGAPNGETLPSIQRQLHRDALNTAARYGRADPKRSLPGERQRQVFSIHGWEYCFYRQEAKFDALLVAAKDGKPATAEFVVLCRKGEYKGPNLEFQWGRLEDKEILVDRGNCGELVHLWIDLQTVPYTGRKGIALASLRNAESAEQAILSVYFREAEACVVTRESFEEVKRHNPGGLSSKLEVVSNSTPMLRYVAATSEASMTAVPEPLEVRKKYVETGSGLAVDMPGEKWTLIAARSEHFATLEEFTRLYYEKVILPTRKTPAPAAAPSARAAAGNTKPATVAEERGRN